jgi:U4/U6.U5 tri-snRNP-associated protein 1
MPIVKPKAEVKEVKLSKPAEEPRQLSRSTDVSMAPVDVTIEELEAGEVRVKEEDDDYDMNMNMLDEIEDALKQTESEEAAAARVNDAALGVGTSSEQTFSSGMASTLNILRQQGILAQPTADQMSWEKTQKQRDMWLAEQRR